jgi:spermidine synthase
LPPTLLWGASFPLALAAAAASRGQDAARLLSGVFAANTFGAIIGALGASLLLVVWAGSQRTEQMLIGLSIIAGLLLLLPSRPHWTVLGCGGLAALLGWILFFTVPPIAKVLIAYGRYAATWVGKGEIVYAAEGMNSSVAVSSFPNGILTFHVAGKIQASNVPRDMRLQRMLGHLTTLTTATPRSVLVIGCGAGITAGAVSIDPRVERETIVEIEPLVPQAASAYFSEPNFGVLRNPKVQIRIDDGRHYLMTTKERFDGITVDPLDPWVKGAANLYTKEFLEVMKQHLNRDGVVTMYIQLFETDLEAVKSSVATFFEVFPNGTIWGNPYQGQGHDMVLLGQVEPLRIDLDEMEQRIGYRGGSKMAQSLAEIGMNSPVDLFARYAGRRSDLREWLRNVPINRDRNLRMQYLAGLGLNLDDAAAIYAGLLAYRRFPEDLFLSAEGRVDSLREAIRRQD